MLWSPSREYKKKDLDDVERTRFMTITKDMVYQWGLSDGRKSCSPAMPTASTTTFSPS